ncbi:hypothetical protein [Nocardioides sp.]|uniref:hypothetical protein n=1 Tax=Nocardioides sp. TaxID=35761 RepID=UPI002ED30275
MFAHHCTACDRRQLVLSGQVDGIVNTDHGMIVSFRCWCGAEQTMVTGRTARRRPLVSHAA